MSGSINRLDHEFATWFDRFLSIVAGSPGTWPGSPSPDNLLLRSIGQPDLLTENWLARTTAICSALSSEQRGAQEVRRGELRTSIQRTAAEINWDNMEETFERSAKVHTKSSYPIDPNQDFCYVKINHGFWEHLYSLFGDHDPEKMRITNPDIYQRQYLNSLFLEALIAALQRDFESDGVGIRISGIEFGLSLINGARPHLLRRQQREPWSSPPLRGQLVQIGAAIGCTGLLRHLFEDKPLLAADGCFPRCGLFEGGLGLTLGACITHADAVVHVVPPHLNGMRLLHCRLPQDCLIIPANCVHECWVGALQDICAYLLRRLGAGERLLVTTQSAVFAALMGIVLVQARRELIPETGRLWFIDLGQVSDLANPKLGGTWIRSKCPLPTHEPLFTMATGPS